MTPTSWSHLMTPASWSPRRGLDPTPAEARRWLSDELSGPDYHDPWLDTVIRWVLEQLAKLLNGANNLANGGLSPVITALVAVVVIALLVWVLPKVRRDSVAARPDGAVLVDPTVTPATYRTLAAQAFADGRYDDAVLDGLRAIAKDMSDRTLLDDSPGRTAHEVSLELARPFPGHAGRLAQAANTFDAVRYGHRRATAAQAGHVMQLDAELITTRPVPAAPSLQDLPV
jgi:Domain of unknown function (DUF4129)